MRELPPPAVHASRNAGDAKSQALRGLAIGLIAAAVLAYLGAMGTQAAPFLQRLAYWAAVILPGSLLGLGINALVRGWGGLAAHRWAEAGLVALLVSLPHSFVVIVVSALFFGIGLITPIVVLEFWLAVLLISVVLTTINYLATGHQVVQAAVMPMPQPAPEPAPAACSPECSLWDLRAAELQMIAPNRSARPSTIWRRSGRRSREYPRCRNPYCAGSSPGSSHSRSAA